MQMTGVMASLAAVYISDGQDLVSRAYSSLAVPLSPTKPAVHDNLHQGKKVEEWPSTTRNT
jgi:hypothetical protein